METVHVSVCLRISVEWPWLLQSALHKLTRTFYCLHSSITPDFRWRFLTLTLYTLPSRLTSDGDFSLWYFTLFHHAWLQMEISHSDTLLSSITPDFRWRFFTLTLYTLPSRLTSDGDFSLWHFTLFHHAWLQMGISHSDTLHSSITPDFRWRFLTLTLYTLPSRLTSDGDFSLWHFTLFHHTWLQMEISHSDTLHSSITPDFRWRFLTLTLYTLPSRLTSDGDFFLSFCIWCT